MKWTIGLVTVLALGCAGNPVIESAEERAACEQTCRDAGAEAYAYMATHRYRICECFRVDPTRIDPSRGKDIHY